MTVYEISNPCDPYTLEADDLEVAAITLCLLLKGKGALVDVATGETAVPHFMFGGHDGWFKEHFGRTFEESLIEVRDQRKPALIACLESVWIGKPAGREDLRMALVGMPDDATRRDYLEKRHDRMRSSLSDIGGYAWDLASNLRDGEGEGDAPAKSA